MKRLTIEERNVLDYLLNAIFMYMEVDDVLSEEEGEKTYSDGGNFIFSLSEKEYKLLLSAKKKI